MIHNVTNHNNINYSSNNNGGQFSKTTTIRTTPTLYVKYKTITVDNIVNRNKNDPPY